MKIIGILGGMGPLASANLYQQIITIAQNSYDAQQDTDFPPMLIYNLPLFGFDETGLVDNSQVKRQLIEGVKKLEQAGSDFIIIACNTVHYFYKDMQEAINIPIVSIIKETSKLVKKEGYKTVGLLSSESTNELKIYQDEFQKIGINIISVSEQQQKKLNDIILNVMAGKQGEKDEKEIKKIIQNLTNQGAESVILGCTELPLAIKQSSLDTKLFFSTDIIAEVALQTAFRED